VCTLPTTSGSPRIAYPGKCFTSDKEGKSSKAYVERYLDATKSSLLFAKGVISVEGIAEQLLLPVLAEHIDCSLEEHHVALVPVGGLTFKHFLPLFGAGLPPVQTKNALARPVACLIDADPRKQLRGNNEKFRSCYPYEINQDPKCAYKPLSDSIEKLETLTKGRENILVDHGDKTLEYDLAFDNHKCPLIVTEACTHASALRTIIADPATTPDELAEILMEARAATEHLAAHAQAAHVIATCYLQCIDSAKGEHAFALARVLKVLLRFRTRKFHWGEKALASARAAKNAKEKPGISDFKVPRAIANVIRWASRQPTPTTLPLA
jgi:putative ATP-dependent endonuclease of OLD family